MSEITFPVWQLVGLGLTILLSFLGFVFAVWKIVNKLQERQADSALTCARAAEKRAEENEKDLLRLRAELPVEYVRREDWVRNQTIIEAKLDALAAHLAQGGRSGC